MRSGRIRREARQAAFAGAREWDAEQLNPWRNRLSGAWNAEAYAAEWREEFLRRSTEMAEEAEAEAEAGRCPTCGSAA